MSKPRRSARAAIDVHCREFAVRNVQFLDNPIVGGGGGSGVAEGKMATITAGPRDAFARVEPILKKLTRNINMRARNRA